MRRTFVLGAAVVGGLLTMAAPLHAQGYQVRLDTWFMSYAYRGYSLDSIQSSDVITGPDGGAITPDSFAVRCGAGADYCTYFPPDSSLRGNPLVSTLEASLWGLGVQGLRFRLKGRVGADLSDSTVWPAVKPTVQLLEAYAEYKYRGLTVLGGRFNEISRLGFTGLDGAKVGLRLFDRKLELVGYGGWGLAVGAVIPVTSQWVNPLDQYQPQKRQHVLGGGVGWNLPGFSGRWLYQREIDGGSDQNYLFSERTSLDASWRPVSRITISGGADYNIAVGQFGTADVTVSYATPNRFLGTSIGWRRYRPYFPLWTIWEAFSPVSYDAGWASVYVWPTRGLELRGRGEVYGYKETDTATPTVRAENGGWRYSLGIGYNGLRNWRFDYDYTAVKSVGAQAIGWNARVTWEPLRTVFLTADGGRLLRPLEFRYNDVDLWTAALRADWRPLPDVRAMVEARYYGEDRKRPDAAAINNWEQIRINAGLTLYFGSGADTPSLHPAILRIPESRSE
jgi:hypothetical protein